MRLLKTAEKGHNLISTVRRTSVPSSGGRGGTYWGVLWRLDASYVKAKRRTLHASNLIQIKLLFLLICIRFDSWKVRRLALALVINIKFLLVITVHDKADRSWESWGNHHQRWMWIFRQIISTSTIKRHRAGPVRRVYKLTLVFVRSSSVQGIGHRLKHFSFIIILGTEWQQGDSRNTDVVTMMQIDCQVMDTKVVNIKKSSIPVPHSDSPYFSTPSFSVPNGNTFVKPAK